MIDEIVDQLDAFDESDPTETLREAKSALEDDVDEVETLIDELHKFICDAETRISEIDDELDARREAEDEKTAA
jgi:hypothetical protein